MVGIWWYYIIMHITIKLSNVKVCNKLMRFYDKINESLFACGGALKSEIVWRSFCSALVITVRTLFFSFRPIPPNFLHFSREVSLYRITVVLMPSFSAIKSSILIPTHLDRITFVILQLPNLRLFSVFSRFHHIFFIVDAKWAYTKSPLRYCRHFLLFRAQFWGLHTSIELLLWYFNTPIWDFIQFSTMILLYFF